LLILSSEGESCGAQQVGLTPAKRLAREAEAPRQGKLRATERASASEHASRGAISAQRSPCLEVLTAAKCAAAGKSLCEAQQRDRYILIGV